MARNCPIFRVDGSSLFWVDQILTTSPNRPTNVIDSPCKSYKLDADVFEVREKRVITRRGVASIGETHDLCGSIYLDKNVFHIKDDGWNQKFRLWSMLPTVYTIEFGEEEVEIEEEASVTLRPIITPYAAVTFESDDEDVATVDENGVVTGVSAGTATITATINPSDALEDDSVLTATIDVTVTAGA